MRPIHFICLLSVLLIWSCSSSRAPLVVRPVEVGQQRSSSTLLRFEQGDSFSQAMDKAGQQGKLIFLDFYTDYCPPCKIMDEEVFNDRETAEFFNDNFINVKVDGAQVKGANLASLYGVRAYPTLIFTDEKGNALLRKEGGASRTTMRQMAEKVLQTMAAK